ncbi:MAG: 50S ribosomal protein L29 [Candidatus Veblenbacteria bacterium]|nr:50S ribosomal protein L29 [Candidatus Veblenbacteria bacterium]MDZ4229629.1 50S ribosomal protein L29 [Candidatus Veblenbacteria bacterium]
MKLPMKDIRTKERPELDRLLKETQIEIRQLKVKVAAQDLKDVRALRSLRRSVARLSTRLSEIKRVKS